ncbi:uncharacterized protein LOC134815985 isoform X2 [Bolinopsis microptera]|uniref:uncharacterized protein LOC134815985 isoform X2 n=1 Tax=Bolinopsis microptera TaxID=2820187 RepID=UPI003079E88D
MFKVMFLPVLILVFILPVTSVQVSTALKFGDDGYSIISFQPNMLPLTDKFTVCLWFKALRGSTSAVIYAYEQGEMYLYDNKGDNNLFGAHFSLPSEFITPMRVWTHHCGTWSVASRTYRAYINGKLAGFKITASGRRLKTGGTLVLGDYRDPAVHGRTGNQFGGEMYNLNFFSKELTGSEVGAMSADGLCTKIPEELEQYRAIRWEDMLSLPRRGNVQDIGSGCSESAYDFIGEKETLRLSLNNTQAELQKLQRLFNSTQEELRTVKRNLLSTTEELNSTRIELEETSFELNETRTKLDNSTLKEAGCTEESRTRCALQRGSLTKWDFYTPVITTTRFSISSNI